MSHDFKEPTFKGKPLTQLSSYEWDAYRRECQKELKRSIKQREIGISFKNGEPCKHPGCKNHITHPCEVCGRYNAQGEVWL